MDRKILVVRHGERCDYHFRKRGIRWVDEAFDSKGRYKRFDNQLPKSLPERSAGYRQYLEDSPITEHGFGLAVQSGENLRKREIKIDVIYASPAFRCVQTAQGILQGLNDPNVRIRVEPGLFQWTHWCKRGIPTWLQPEELRAGGYSVDANYQMIDSPVDFDMSETLRDYYERSFKLMKNILAKHNKETILLVAHAGSLDTLTRQLCGGSPLERGAFSEVLHKTSYLSCCEADEQPDHSWEIMGSPIPLLVYTGLDKCDSD